MNDDIDALLVGNPLVAPPGFAARLTALAHTTPQLQERSRSLQAMAVGVPRRRREPRSTATLRIRIRCLCCCRCAVIHLNLCRRSSP